MNESRRAEAEYIASMCSELADLAEKHGFGFGSYLLRMAHIEFKAQQDRSEGRTAASYSR
jgi:hypothetical protein